MLCCSCRQHSLLEHCILGLVEIQDDRPRIGIEIGAAHVHLQFMGGDALCQLQPIASIVGINMGREKREFGPADAPQPIDRKSVESGKSVTVRVDLVGLRIIKKKNSTHKKYNIEDSKT